MVFVVWKGKKIQTKQKWSNKCMKSLACLRVSDVFVLLLHKQRSDAVGKDKGASNWQKGKQGEMVCSNSLGSVAPLSSTSASLHIISLAKQTCTVFKWEQYYTQHTALYLRSKMVIYNLNHLTTKLPSATLFEKWIPQLGEKKKNGRKDLCVLIQKPWLQDIEIQILGSYFQLFHRTIHCNLPVYYSGCRRWYHSRSCE